MNVLCKCLLAISILVTAQACKKDADNLDDSGDPLVGKWEIVEATGSLADANLGTIYTFKSDLTFKIGEGLLSSEGTYDRTSSVLTLNFDGASIVFVYDYTLNDDKLTLDNTTSDQVFVLEKI